jgi:hypoxanthine phosphoribosyltransferase
LVLDDVLDSGITLTQVKEELLRLGAAEVKTAVMVDKPSGRKVECRADYVGLMAPGAFLVGYGMDANELYRNLPYIGVVRD